MFVGCFISEKKTINTSNPEPKLKTVHFKFSFFKVMGSRSI